MKIFVKMQGGFMENAALHFYLSLFSIGAIAKIDKWLLYNRDILSNFATVLRKNIKIIINLKPTKHV